VTTAWWQTSVPGLLAIGDCQVLRARGERPAIFLDRDGVLNELVREPATCTAESPLEPASVRLTAGAPEAVAKLDRAGFALVCVTNQPAAAKGKTTIDRLCAVHERVLELLRDRGARVDASLLCLHHPAGRVPTLARPCCCRKPRPGMLLHAAAALRLDLQASWMIGDTDADLGAGRSAGCKTALVVSSASAHKRSTAHSPDLYAPDLAHAVRTLLAVSDSRL
jgi:histidinol-phosphate phosphatase family protein